MQIRLNVIKDFKDQSVFYFGAYLVRIVFLDRK